MAKKASGESTPEPQYAVELDLATASSKQFEAAREKFFEWADTQPPYGPLDLTNGWYDLEPLPTVQDFLRRNQENRIPSFARVKQYWWSMAHGDWRSTGQGLIFDKEGKMQEGGQRCWGSYFGKVGFRTYVITDAPAEPDLFAYMDDVKARTPGDALHGSGMDGLSNHIAAAAWLAYRYQHEVLGCLGQPKLLRKLNTREILAYTRAHPELNQNAHLLAAYKAVPIIGYKHVAIVFADLVVRYHGQPTLDDFLVSLGSGANLDEHDPILGLRNRLVRGDLKKEQTLALLLKAFNLHLQDKKLTKQGLFVRDNEAFPKILTVDDLKAEVETE